MDAALAMYDLLDRRAIDEVATRLRKLTIKELRVLADHFKLRYDRDCRKDFFIDELAYLVYEAEQ